MIDWELAGFFPFAYEYGYKDTVLGSSNLFFSWYTMFKAQTAHLLPQAEGHEKLVKALRIIDESDRRHGGRTVGMRVQEKWVRREQVEESANPRQGWIRKVGAQAPGGRMKDVQATLELEVLK